MIVFFKFPLEDSLAGAEFHTLKLAQHFERLGHETKLISSDKKLLNLFAKHSLDHEYLDIGREPTSKLAILFWFITYFKAQTALRPIIKNLPQNSVLFFQSLTEKLLLTELAHKLGHRAIWLEHKNPGRWLKRNPLLGDYLKASKKAIVVTFSNFEKQEFISLGIPAGNIKIIYHGVKSQQLRISPRNYTIGLLSRLAPEKGVLNFLRIITPTLKNHPNWKILIGGEGKEKSVIKKHIINNQLEIRVKLLGFVEDKKKFFQNTSVFVYPSVAPESFGLAALEAQSFGIPVIATKIGALPEVVQEDRSGFLIKPEDENGWVKALMVLEDDKINKKMGTAALENANNFPEEKMFDCFEKL